VLGHALCTQLVSAGVRSLDFSQENLKSVRPHPRFWTPVVRHVKAQLGMSVIDWPAATAINAKLETNLMVGYGKEVKNVWDRDDKGWLKRVAKADFGEKMGGMRGHFLIVVADGDNSN